MSLNFILKFGKCAAFVVAAAIISCQATGLAAEPETPVPTVSTNRLATEKSPYLLQHQHNPVQWYPWGPEAFEKARREQKPIFLSIGYSTCHWCHVMAHESFENPEIARLMNESFVNIKVDREERPDVDRVYMTFVQASTGGGGWPLSVFLTPDLTPFVGGTYFPPDDRYGRPGFPSVLKRIAEAWKTDQKEILDHGRKVLEQLRPTPAAPASKLDPAAAFDLCLNQLTAQFDSDLGGFGDAPKFPRPVTLNFLFRAYARDLDKNKTSTRDGKAALGMALLTLRKMAEGGMHDHLAGGFHRYSVDKFWHVPHFEKMLYDQAQLACCYLDAFQITRDSSFASTARDILDYVQRDLTDKNGGFYSAEDADSLLAHGKPEHGEGAFAVWTKTEIEAALGEQAAGIFNGFYGVEANGNAPQGSDPHGEFKGKNILIQRLSLADAAKAFHKPESEIASSLQSSRAILAKIRAARPKPHLDDKIITAWNGLMISAFARASQVLQEPTYLLAAQRSAAFLRKELWQNGTLIRSYRQGASNVAGFADDYAALIQGLLDLYEADFDIAWLQWAQELQKKQDALFLDPEHGGYFSVGTADPHILLRLKEDYDGAEPSPNSIAALNLLRLAQINAQWQPSALKTIEAFRLTRSPSAMPQMLCAMDASLAKPRQIVIAGPKSAQTDALVAEIHQHFIPNKLLLRADGSQGQAWLAKHLDFLQSIDPSLPAAFVCENFVCQLPVSDVPALKKLLKR